MKASVVLNNLDIAINEGVFSGEQEIAQFEERLKIWQIKVETLRAIVESLKAEPSIDPAFGFTQVSWEKPSQKNGGLIEILATHGADVIEYRYICGDEHNIWDCDGGNGDLRINGDQIYIDDTEDGREFEDFFLEELPMKWGVLSETVIKSAFIKAFKGSKGFHKKV